MIIEAADEVDGWNGAMTTSAPTSERDVRCSGFSDVGGYSAAMTPSPTSGSLEIHFGTTQFEVVVDPVREARLRLQSDGLPGLADLIKVSLQRFDCAAVRLSGLLQLLERFLLSPYGRA
jgi:hypothetical protein